MIVFLKRCASYDVPKICIIDVVLWCTKQMCWRCASNDILMYIIHYNIFFYSYFQLLVLYHLFVVVIRLCVFYISFQDWPSLYGIPKLLAHLFVYRICNRQRCIHWAVHTSICLYRCLMEKKVENEWNIKHKWKWRYDF